MIQMLHSLLVRRVLAVVRSAGIAAVSAAFVAAFVAGSLAPAANAGELSVSFQKHGQHGSLGFTFGQHHAEPPRHYAPHREWVPGRYETILERVWVGAREERVWVDPVYENRYEPCGRVIAVCVRAGYWKTVCVPAHYENHKRQVWQPGYYRVIGC